MVTKSSPLYDFMELSPRKAASRSCSLEFTKYFMGHEGSVLCSQDPCTDP